MITRSKMLRAAVLSVSIAAGLPALADQKGGGGTVLKGADCERQTTTVCGIEYQLDGKGGTTQTWVCKKVVGDCVVAMTGGGTHANVGATAANATMFTRPPSVQAPAAGVAPSLNRGVLMTHGNLKFGPVPQMSAHRR